MSTVNQIFKKKHCQPILIIALVIALLSILSSCSNNSKTKSVPIPKQGLILNNLLKKKSIRCGINTQLPGFGFKSGRGEYSGFDIDICRAIAAALYGDANKVSFLDTQTSERFRMFNSGEIDILVRNTSSTLRREIEVSGYLSRIYFYDGLGIMVYANSSIKNLYQLQDHPIGVIKGSSAEKNLGQQLAARNLSSNLVIYNSVKELISSYRMGRVEAICADKSALAAEKATLPSPQNHWIMDITLSKEPFAIILPKDPSLRLVIDWVINALIIAEEYGITSKNIDHIAKNATLPQVRQFLGLEGNYGEALGLKNDWAYQIIRQVGNYKEIYRRNLGEDTIFNIPRGYNKLFNQRGLLYAPPLD